MPKKIPLRKCVGCQEMKDKRSLIRIVRTQEGAFFKDDTGRKNGRGAYICPQKGCLEAAIKSKGLERSFQCAIPANVYDELKKEFELYE